MLPGARRSDSHGSEHLDAENAEQLDNIYLNAEGRKEQQKIVKPQNKFSPLRYSA
jgi:hypothetical protein